MKLKNINKPYILFTRIEVYRTNSGRLFCDPLWSKDLLLHLDYIDDFSLCCPVIISDDVDGLEDITDYKIKSIYELAKDYGFVSVFKNLLPSFFKVKKACKAAEIVHSGGAGWAFPLSFYILFLKKFYKFKWVIVIESSFWLLAKNDKRTLRNVITHITYKYILRFCVKYADARIFTQSYYRSFFLHEDKRRTLVAAATWIDNANLIAFPTMEKRFSDIENRELNIIFPARLEDYKGVFVLFSAIEILKNHEIPLKLTIMGKGSLENICKEFAAKKHGKVKVNYSNPIEYGMPFFNEIRKYDVLLVPNLKEEQPRIIFDAFSQGVCVIASDTAGNLDITTNSENAIICKSGSSNSLAKAIINASKNRSEVISMAKKGRETVLGKTHVKMHIERHHFLINTLDV